MPLMIIRKPSSAVPGAALTPVWVRICHWLNAVAVVLMLLSGWRIYDASPVFHWLVIPSAWTIGGWLGGALQWHFAAMWLLVINGFFYLSMNFLSGRMRATFLPLSPGAVWQDFKAALHGRLSHADLSRYNAVQKLAYLFAIADIVLMVVSGLAIWKSVQFPLLRVLMGGYDSARIVHFIAMALLMGFVIVHLLMVALVPRSLLTMLRGR